MDEAPLEEFLVMEYPSGGGQSEGQQLIMTVNDAGEEVEEQMVVREEEDVERLQQHELDQGDPEQMIADNYIIEISQEEAEEIHDHQEEEMHHVEEEQEEDNTLAIEGAILHEGPRTERRHRPVQMKYGDDICMVSYEQVSMVNWG